jgi:hypothetical protein
MFSNLFSRITGLNLNTLFYLAFGLVFALSIKKFLKPISDWKILYYLLLFWLSIFIFDFRYDFSANLLSIKDFIIPVLSLVIGYSLAYYKTYIVNFLNLLYFIFISYGIFQEIVFYYGGLSALELVLPWDGNYLDYIISEGIINYFQGTLLRFFGTMNAFVEYQIFVVGVLFFIWVNISDVKHKNLFRVNQILMILFLILCFERTPVAMAIIFITVWKATYLISKIRRLFFWGMVVAIVGCIFVYIGQNTLQNNPLISSAYKRLSNVLTLNLGNDAAIKDRSDERWADALNSAQGNFFGTGLETVTPSAHQHPRYIGPHNNYLAYYMGYGVIGLGIVLTLLIVIALKIYPLNSNYRYFGYGLMLSYAGMALFNLPYSGKQGILFFLILGFLLSLRTITIHSQATSIVAKESISPETSIPIFSIDSNV